MSSSAASQETGSKLAVGRGVVAAAVTRSGSFWTSAIAIPFGHANPLRNG